jgi:hypothetical protein
VSKEVGYARRKKPSELLELYEVAAILFTSLKETFNVPETYEVSLRHVDVTAHHLHDPGDVAAFAMLQVQALRLIATSSCGSEILFDVPPIKRAAAVGSSGMAMFLGAAYSNQA